MSTLDVNDPSVKVIDAGVKNKFKWSWLQNSVHVNGECVDFSCFTKLPLPGQVLCTLCQLKVSYGSSGKKALRNHVCTPNHFWAWKSIQGDVEIDFKSVATITRPRRRSTRGPGGGRGGRRKRRRSREHQEGAPPRTEGEDRKYDFGSLSSSSGGGAPFAPGLNENSTESGEGAAGGGGGGGGGGGACEEGPVPMSPEQFLCEDMEHAGGASPHTPSSSSHQRPESYKLRHNNHLTLVLESLAGDESFMDVTLTAQGKAIKAHKSVLSAVSPYFRSVLKENPCQHPIIIMPRDIRFEELNNIISYVYKGEMTVAAEDLSSMLKTAEVLQVTGLSPSEAGSGAGGIMSHMQGLPAGVFGAGAAPPAKAKKAKHVHTQQHQVVAHEEEPHAANNHDIRGRIDPLDFLNADMTCVKEEIPSDTEETEDMGFTLPDDSSGPASKVTEPLPAAASFSSDPSTTRHPSNRRKSLDSPRPMDDPSNKPFNPGEPGPSPTEPQAAAAATPSPSSTPPPPHVCPHCLETHRPTDALHSHLRLKHPSKPSFVCASCGKVFLRHSLFAEHSKKCKV